MNNIQKAFKAKRDLGLRMAAGGVIDQSLTEGSAVARLEGKGQLFDPNAPLSTGSRDLDTLGTAQGSAPQFALKSFSELSSGNDFYKAGSANDPKASASLIANPKPMQAPMQRPSPVPTAGFAAPELNGAASLKQAFRPGMADGGNVAQAIQNRSELRQVANYDAPAPVAAAPAPAPVAAAPAAPSQASDYAAQAAALEAQQLQAAQARQAAQKPKGFLQRFGLRDGGIVSNQNRPNPHEIARKFVGDNLAPVVDSLPYAAAQFVPGLNVPLGLAAGAVHSAQGRTEELPLDAASMVPGGKQGVMLAKGAQKAFKIGVGNIGRTANGAQTLDASDAFGSPAYKQGGIVTDGSKRNVDDVDVTLAHDEAVLPSKTVEALGGPEAVKQIIETTNGKPTVNGGLREGGHYADGVPPMTPDEAARAAAKAAKVTPVTPVPAAAPAVEGISVGDATGKAYNQAKIDQMRANINTAANGPATTTPQPTLSAAERVAASRAADMANAEKVLAAQHTVPAAAPAATPTAAPKASWTTMTPESLKQGAKQAIIDKFPNAFKSSKEAIKGAAKTALKNFNTITNGTVAAGDVAAGAAANEGGVGQQALDTLMAYPRVLGGSMGMDVDLKKMQRGLVPIEAAGNTAAGFLADSLPTGWISGLGLGAANAATGFRPVTTAVQKLRGDSPIESTYREDYGISKENMPGVVDNMKNVVAGYGGNVNTQKPDATKGTVAPIPGAPAATAAPATAQPAAPTQQQIAANNEDADKTLAFAQRLGGIQQGAGDPMNNAKTMLGSVANDAGVRQAMQASHDQRGDGIKVGVTKGANGRNQASFSGNYETKPDLDRVNDANGNDTRLTTQLKGNLRDAQRERFTREATATNPAYHESGRVGLAAMLKEDEINGTNAAKLADVKMRGLEFQRGLNNDARDQSNKDRDFENKEGEQHDKQVNDFIKSLSTVDGKPDGALEANIQRFAGNFKKTKGTSPTQHLNRLAYEYEIEKLIDGMGRHFLTKEGAWNGEVSRFKKTKATASDMALHGALPGQDKYVDPKTGRTIYHNDIASNFSPEQQKIFFETRVLK